MVRWRSGLRKEVDDASECLRRRLCYRCHGQRLAESNYGGSWRGSPSRLPHFRSANLEHDGDQVISESSQPLHKMIILRLQRQYRILLLLELLAKPQQMESLS